MRGVPLMAYRWLFRCPCGVEADFDDDAPAYAKVWLHSEVRGHLGRVTRVGEGAPAPCTLNLTPYADTPGVCDACGKPLVGRQRRWCSRECSFVEWNDHDWNSARKAARRRDGHQCVTCGSREALEVNHIIPRVGAGYSWGCWNHQDNLETLCHDCHVKVTKAQAAARRAAAKAIAPAGLF